MPCCLCNLEEISSVLSSQARKGYQEKEKKSNLLLGLLQRSIFLPISNHTLHTMNLLNYLYLLALFTFSIVAIASPINPSSPGASFSSDALDSPDYDSSTVPQNTMYLRSEQGPKREKTSRMSLSLSLSTVTSRPKAKNTNDGLTIQANQPKLHDRP